MTPAQEKALAVALDGLKESGVESADVVRALFDAATAGRMLRAQVMFAALKALSAALTANPSSGGDHWAARRFINAHGGYSEDLSGHYVLAEVVRLALSPPEKAPATSTHQPPGETP